MTEDTEFWKDRAEAAEADRNQLSKLSQNLIEGSRALLKEISAGLDWNAELPAEPSMARELMLACRALDEILKGTVDNEPVDVLQRRYDHMLEDRHQHITTWKILGKALRGIAHIAAPLIPRGSLGEKVITEQLEDIAEFLLGPPKAPRVVGTQTKTVDDRWAVEVQYAQDAGAKWAMRIIAETLGEALRRQDGSFWNSIETSFTGSLAGEIVVTAQRKDGKTLSQQKKEAEDQLEIAKTALRELAPHLTGRVSELGRRLSARGRVGEHISASEGHEITDAVCSAVDIFNDVKKKIDLGLAEED